MEPIVSIFVIATKGYLIYAAKLIESASRLPLANFQIQFIVLTDDQNSAQDLLVESESTKISIHKIASYGWPEATLFRFKLMSDHWSAVQGSIVMYMDADTEFVNSFSYQDLLGPVLSSRSGMVLVQHPGYFKRSWFLRPLFKSRFGPWESRRCSKAFVRYSYRKRYVCGGVYWGSDTSFLQLCNRLAHSITEDDDISVRAKHNDESHLNAWLSQNHATLVTPAWAYASGYRNLRKIRPVIEVIHKPSDFSRIPT